MIDFKKLFVCSFVLLFSISVFGNKTVHVRRSVAFDAFSDDTQYSPRDLTDDDLHGHHAEGDYPESFPPPDPLHDDDDKFSMRCQSGSSWDDFSTFDHCKAVLTVDISWNIADPSDVRSCVLQVTLTANGSVFDYDTGGYYEISGDCALDEKKIDGVGVWVVHPKTIIKKRTTTATFKGRFTETQAAIWAKQIYQNLNENIKNLMKNYTATYKLSNDGTQLDFSIPAYYEISYTCQDWC